MIKSNKVLETAAMVAGLWVLGGCSGSESAQSAVGGSPNAGGGSSNVTNSAGATSNGGSRAGSGGTLTMQGGAVATGGSGTSSSALSTGGASPLGGSAATGGSLAAGGASKPTGGSSFPSGGQATGGQPQTGGAKASGGSVGIGGTTNIAGSKATGGGATGGSVSTGGSKATGGVTAMGGTLASGGTAPTGGAKSTGGSSSGGNSSYPCNGTTTGYNAVMTKSGSTWTVVNGGTQRYSGTDTQAALTAAYNSLTAGRTSKQSVLVQGDGDIPASAQVAMPSYTVVNWCGTLNISGSGSGDYSPFYARGKTDVEIANLTMTGSPSYGIFFRGTNNMTLGNITLRLSGGSPGIGIRVDTSGSAATDTTFVTNLNIGYVYGTGMSSHIVETYGVNGATIGTVEGDDVGECGLLFNRSINCTATLVSCNNCGAGTGYAAFRVANSVGKVGSSFPAGNIHVGKVVARAGGRGVFSVSGCGGLTIDQVDIANTGSTSILLQNTYNTTIAAVSGTVVGGLVQISNDTTNTNNGTYAPSQNVALQNLTLSGGASVRQDWCTEFGRNGCTATNITGGTVSMCP